MYHQKTNFENINESLETQTDEPSRVKAEFYSPKVKDSQFTPSLVFNSLFFELGIPYLFSNKEYTILSSNEIYFPGFILDQKICFLLLIPKTIDYFLSSKPPQLFNALVNEFSQIHLIFFSHSFTNLSFDFQCELLHAANRHNVWITFLSKEEDLSKLVKRVFGNSMYKDL
ncbi:MAG: hypothetical protein ACFFDT_11935 [Candidatus Hodarchaeota archaeon]